jgi:phospho-N-acetylmuramoyl-pentapeptide-transferase
VTLLVAALLSLILVGAFIRLAGRYGWGKHVRRDGPAEHLRKEGTPTMGGAAFLLAALLVWLIWGPHTADGWAIAALTLAAGLLGLADDLLALRRPKVTGGNARGVTGGNARGVTGGNLKVTKGNARGRVAERDASTGLLARHRLAVQVLFALGFAGYAVGSGHHLFSSDILSVLAYAFVVVGAINALNFSDGLDGLAGGMSILILLPFFRMPLALPLAGALLGFLWYNAKPARVFMGGVGSEALGAAIAALAILSDWTWWLPLIALLPVLEVISVILQVSYFRATRGGRLFKMSPLHHHFELSGWAEQQVVMRFWLVTAVCVGLAWGLKGGLP